MRTCGPLGARLLRPALTVTLIGCCVPALTAGVIKGIALENLTGLPLARARLTLLRLVGNRLEPAAAAIASRNGQFEFAPLQEGYYQLSGIRDGFAETRFGQRRNGGPGTPIFVPRDGTHFIELRLKRLGAITGRTLDENHVGLPGISVSAYRDEAPLASAGSATSDDRGIYRIKGLLPGRYFVRTGPAQLEAGLNVLPTYFPFKSVVLRDARPVVVDVDADTTDADIQPSPGNLLSLEVSVRGCVGAANVTISTDTGRRQQSAPCNGGPVTFSGLAPGEYEALAEGDGEGTKVAGFLALYLDREREIGLALRPLSSFTLRLVDGGGVTLRDAAIHARRRDPARAGPEQALTEERASLAPGFWEITARPPSSHYLAGIKADTFGFRRTPREPSRDWFEFYLDYSAAAIVSLSAHPAQLQGRVTLRGEAAIAAPVYLLPVMPLTRRRMNGLRTTYTDTNGGYRFEGLAPGEYLMLSSFDLAQVDEATLESARAPSVTIEEGRTVTQDLELYQMP